MPDTETQSEEASADAAPVARASGHLSLSAIQEWSKWLSALELGAIAVLKTLGAPEGRLESTLAIAAVAVNVAALLATGWLMSTIPFVYVELGQIADDPDPRNDVLNYRAYKETRAINPLLSTVVLVQHGLWLLGVVLFGSYVMVGLWR